MSTAPVFKLTTYKTSVLHPEASCRETARINATFETGQLHDVMTLN